MAALRLALALAFVVTSTPSPAQTNTPPVAVASASTVEPPVPVPTPTPPRYRKFKAVDADNHSVLLNRPGLITLVLGTNEDSQDAARSAGKVMYPFQGRPDFQLVVVVDLRDSLATWAPDIVLSEMRSNLDEEAIELKPYFLKNGNKSNPRYTTYVVPDFKGTICPALGWTDSSDNLRGILFGADGLEIERWDKIGDTTKLDAEVRTAIQALIDADKAKAAQAAKTQGTKLIQPPAPHPPLLPPATAADSN
ncbi:MAG TPA: hypothetical protein VGC39_10660 [Candidatus Methylacidiphilales bacterium]